MCRKEGKISYTKNHYETIAKIPRLVLCQPSNFTVLEKFVKFLLADQRFNEAKVYIEAFIKQNTSHSQAYVLYFKIMIDCFISRDGSSPQTKKFWKIFNFEPLTNVFLCFFAVLYIFKMAVVAMSRSVWQENVMEKF